MFMSPRNAAGRSAGGKPRRRARAWKRGAELEVAEVGADHREVRAVDVDLGLEQGAGPRVERQLRQRERCGWCGSASATAGPGTSRRCPWHGSGSARLTSVGRGSRSARAIGTATRRSCPAPRHRVVRRHAAVGRPCLLQHDDVGLERAHAASRSKAGQPSRRSPRPQCTLKDATVSSGTGSALGLEGVDAGRELRQRSQHREVVARQGPARRARAPRSRRRARAPPARRWRARAARRCGPSCPPSRTWWGRSGAGRGCAGRWPRPSRTRSPPARAARRARSGRSSSPGGAGRPW